MLLFVKLTVTGKQPFAFVIANPALFDEDVSGITLKGNVKERKDFENLFYLCEDKITNDSKLCLINNAGIAVFTPSEDRTYEEFLKVSEVNLLGPIFGLVCY